MRNQEKGKATVVLVVDHKNPHEYTSMYGYKKRWLNAHAVSWVDGKFTCPVQEVSEIKEEPVPVPDLPFEFVYYCKNAGRQSGQPRFFRTPEDLLRAYGYVVAKDDSQEAMREALEEYNGKPLPKKGEKAADEEASYEEDLSDLSPRQRTHAKKLGEEAKEASKKFYGYVDKARKTTSGRVKPNSAS